MLLSIIKADKLQVILRIIMRLRGFTWSWFAFLVMKDAKIGKALNAIGWPSLTHRNGQINIGDNCFIGKGTLKVTEGAELEIGDRVLINNGFVISSNEKVCIGNDSLIGEYVSIRDADHAFDSLELTISKQGMKTAPIVIGDNVWIGRGTVILKGVVIGEGVIIGANSVVTKDIEAHSIVVGNPARLIKSRVGV